MQYIDNTTEVKTVVESRGDLFETMKGIFESHEARDGKYEALGEGNTRTVCEVGTCCIPSFPDQEISLILKIGIRSINNGYVSRRFMQDHWREFGAAETYFDFVVGNISTLRFRTKAGYDRYVSKNSRRTKMEFSLSERWGGTRVRQGDIGALPYFQMVVKYKNWFGCLTEGLPCVREPEYSAYDFQCDDDCTVENGRIIDLGSSQCSLIWLDQGGFVADHPYPGNLGVCRRGEKYFKKVNRLYLV